MPEPIAKYRPVLSASQILHIIKLLKRDGTSLSLETLRNLSRFEWQIQNDAVSPAYISIPTPSMIEDLGFDEPAAIGNAHISSSEINIEALYHIWMVEPESLTALDISKVRQWRYENNKMTVDEEKLFESEVLGF
jgi:hypothetical protein